MPTTWVSTISKTLDIDATVKESHKSGVDVTDHPVEQGINVSDHARPKPDEVTLEGIVSNTPDIPGVTGGADDARQFLHGLRDDPEFVTISTAARTYYDMILTDLKEDRDKKSGDAFRFEASFKQVRRVTNQTTVVATKQPKSKPKAQQGTQVAVPSPTYSAPDGKYGRFWTTVSTAGQSSR
jgi:hypothetical protein